MNKRNPTAKPVITDKPKKVGQPEKFEPADVIAALKATMGMRTLAARQLGCAYGTIRRYIETYPEIADAEREARENMLDKVELKLYDKCMKDDTTAIIFMLKTLGRNRGYVERSEHRIMDMSKLSDDELHAIVES